MHSKATKEEVAIMRAGAIIRTNTGIDLLRISVVRK